MFTVKLVLDVIIFFLFKKTTTGQYKAKHFEDFKMLVCDAFIFQNVDFFLITF